MLKKIWKEIKLKELDKPASKMSKKQKIKTKKNELPNVMKKNRVGKIDYIFLSYLKF